jgi:hypothetical protein
MSSRAESRRAQPSRPDPALAALSSQPVCHGIATPSHRTATVACKSSRERPLPPCGAGGSAS